MGTAIVMDFTDVKEQSGFNPVRQDPGDYRGKVKSVTAGKSKENNNPMLTYAIQDVNRPSAVYRFQCVLTPNSMWKMRNLIVACGLTNPTGKKLRLDPERLVGRELGMSLDDDEYNGNVRSQIINVFPASELEETEVSSEDDVDDEEDEPAPKQTPRRNGKAVAKKPAKPAVDEAEDEDDEDLDTLDIDDL
ncbi:MAG: hypothetical protein AB7L09_22320 [Nitrospira sp.]